MNDLREYGIAPSRKGREYFGSHSIGWGEVSTLLKFYVEHGLSY